CRRARCPSVPGTAMSLPHPSGRPCSGRKRCEVDARQLFRKALWLSNHPHDDSDGYIDVEISGVAMRWQVLRADREPGEGLSLGGITVGSEAPFLPRCA